MTKVRPITPNKKTKKASDVASVLVTGNWITLLEKANIDLDLICLEMQVAAEDLEIKATIDGTIYTGAQAGAGIGTPYYFTLFATGPGVNIASSTAVYMVNARYATLPTQSAKIEIRKTSAAGANICQSQIIYHGY